MSDDDDDTWCYGVQGFRSKGQRSKAHSPETTSGRSGVNGATKGRPAGGLRGQIGCQGRDGLGIVAGIVGKLDRHRFSGSLWDGAVQLLNRSLSLDSLIESDEAYSLGQA